MCLMKNKILLIEPPYFRLFKNSYSLDIYPLALGYLSGVIKQHTSWNVTTYNADFNENSEFTEFGFLAGQGFKNYIKNLEDPSMHVWKEIEQTILDLKPDVVGISTNSRNFASALKVANLVKKINNNTLVILGGSHPSTAGKDILKNDEVDVIVVGEGERTIVELLKFIEDNKDLEQVEGIIFKKEGNIIETPRRPLIENLDSLPFPHEFAPEILKDYNKYPVTAFKSIFSTRGCPFNCFYCGAREIWGRKPRIRSVENVIKEIKLLQELGVKFINFRDDLFRINNDQIKKLCLAILEHFPGLKWVCEFSAKLVDDATIKIMKKAGCYKILLSVESGNNFILDKMRKNVTIEEIFNACKIIKSNRIELSALFMVGFPYETEETLKDTLKAIKKIKADSVTLSTFCPYPGTEIFKFCKEHNLIKEDYNPSLQNHQSREHCFCLNLDQEKFNTLVSKMEKITDNKNRRNRIKKLFSLRIFDMIKETGIKKNVKNGVRLIFKK